MTNHLEKFKTVNRIVNSKLEGGYRIENKKSKLNAPLITVITATYNSEKYLEESIQSLHNQTVRL